MELNTIELLIVFIFTIIIHEIGHIIGFYIIGLKPKIKFKWYAIRISNEYLAFRTPIEIFFINLLGVWTGLVYLLFFNNNILYVAYFFASLFDISQTILILFSGKLFSRLSYFEIMQEDLKDLKALKNKLGIK